jgi:SHS2 domain-containing protein
MLSGLAGRYLRYDEDMGEANCRRASPVRQGREQSRARLIAQDAMLSFRILEHTADIGFEAFGSTLPEVFENAARALAHLIAEPANVKPTAEIRIEVLGANAPDLLVNWLSEILFQHDAEGWLFRDFRVENLDDHAITGIALGEKFDQARHQANLMVKAVTYHQLALQQTAGGWRAQVYLDI